MTSTTGHNCVSTACQQICQPSFGISRGANLCQRLQIRPCLNLPEPLVRPCLNLAQDPCSLQKWFSGRIMRKTHGERTGNVRGTLRGTYGERRVLRHFLRYVREDVLCVFLSFYRRGTKCRKLRRSPYVPRAFPERSPYVPRAFPVYYGISSICGCHASRRTNLS